MGKALKTAGMVIAVVALVAATAGAAFPAVAGSAGGIFGVSAATLGQVAMWGSISAGVMAAHSILLAKGAAP